MAKHRAWPLRTLSLGWALRKLTWRAPIGASINDLVVPWVGQHDRDPSRADMIDIPREVLVAFLCQEALQRPSPDPLDEVTRKECGSIAPRVDAGCRAMGNVGHAFSLVAVSARAQV